MIGLSGGVWFMQAETKVSTSATTFTTSWNWRNFCTFSYTERPHMTDFAMDEKRSSRMMMSAASLATSVPAMPIARPTSDALSAGASLVPSPVTPTTAR